MDKYSEFYKKLREIGMQDIGSEIEGEAYEAGLSRGRRENDAFDLLFLYYQHLFIVASNMPGADKEVLRETRDGHEKQLGISLNTLLGA